jgi:hypothetical protein
MPAYGGNGTAGLLNANRTAYFWQSEIVPVNTFPGSLSVAYQLERVPNVVAPWGAGFEVNFAGNPGVFEIDIVGTNLDQAQNYGYLGSITAAVSYVSGYYVGRWDLPSYVWVKYVAAYMKTLTNAVQTTLLVTR